MNLDVTAETTIGCERRAVADHVVDNPQRSDLDRGHLGVGASGRAVFERFVTSADAAGTGLGLAIAKRLVEAHGGTIEARSPANEGTTNRLVIPTR